MLGREGELRRVLGGVTGLAGAALGAVRGAGTPAEPGLREPWEPRLGRSPIEPAEGRGPAGLRLIAPEGIPG